jgi:hypothetical protein
MDKNILSEELSGMKYLFGYEPGKVISEQKSRPERLVKHRETGDVVGTYIRGVGFHPNMYGEEMGYEYHPTEIPHGTKFGGIEIDDFDYEDEDFFS